MVPRRGTRGVMLARRSSFIFSMSSHRTPEWPRIREFMRIRIAPRTQASGILVVLRGSWRGRTSRGLVEEGSTPLCWCWRRALPRRRGWSVRVSALPPNPVDTPYMLRPASTLSTITLRLLASFAFKAGDSSRETDAWYLAAAVTAAMDRFCPSTTTGLPFLCQR